MHWLNCGELRLDFQKRKEKGIYRKTLRGGYPCVMASRVVSRSFHDAVRVSLSLSWTPVMAGPKPNLNLEELP